MTMTITPQFIQQVFAEKPHVHRAFVENVPQKLDEKEFWTRFAKHEIQIQVDFRGIPTIRETRLALYQWFKRQNPVCNWVVWSLLL